MTKRAWVKDEMTGKWSSFDPVVRRQIEREAAKEAAERAEAMKDKAGWVTGYGDGISQGTGDI